MSRVHILVEGPTEELFVKELLGPHLIDFDVLAHPVIIGKKGGDVSWKRVKTDLLLLLKDSTSHVTTLFDFYGLGSGFTGHPWPEHYSLSDKKQALEQFMRDELAALTLPQAALHRFVPYVQMFKFEGLLFSEPKSFWILELEGLGNSDASHCV